MPIRRDVSAPPSAQIIVSYPKKINLFISPFRGLSPLAKIRHFLFFIFAFGFAFYFHFFVPVLPFSLHHVLFSPPTEVGGYDRGLRSGLI
jgi:hypothetical protein